ncbi:MAG: cytochrome c oxidase assembly protein [Caulobacteraceae bacterium]|nr:cytochrome c oxidase assembly protein [Caulobacteraceae bacterium]
MSFPQIRPFASYCGAPPAPGELAHRWNLDPVLIIALIALGLIYSIWAPKGARHGAFYSGWTLTALLLVSPLCAFSVALFSARVAQHMLLVTLAAPLIAWARPGFERPALVPRPLLAAALFAGALWFWHAPGPYAATFRGPAVYWTMHLTLFGSAVWLWAALFEAAGERLGAGVAAIALTSLQMGLLGAVITFAARPLYAPHLLTTEAWGLSPLQDQQLGGVVMWIPAGTILAAGLAFAFAQAFRRAEVRALRRALP